VQTVSARIPDYEPALVRSLFCLSPVCRIRPMADSELQGKSLSILMVDDDEEDFILVKDALKSKQLKVDLYWAEDGHEAMNFLFHRGEYADAPTPNLILLDLNMPGKNGFEVLMDLKAHGDLRKIPVVILTASGDQANVSRGYNIGASSFMLKPLSFDEMANAMQSLCEYWFALVQLPKGPARAARKTVKKVPSSPDSPSFEPSR
jgi:CheY-like chemotaxis protein